MEIRHSVADVMLGVLHACSERYGTEGCSPTLQPVMHDRSASAAKNPSPFPYLSCEAGDRDSFHVVEGTLALPAACQTVKTRAHQRSRVRHCHRDVHLHRKSAGSQRTRRLVSCTGSTDNDIDVTIRRNTRGIRPAVS